MDEFERLLTEESDPTVAPPHYYGPRYIIIAHRFRDLRMRTRTVRTRAEAVRLTSALRERGYDTAITYADERIAVPCDDAGHRRDRRREEAGDER